jgi:hypothetical protein
MAVAQPQAAPGVPASATALAPAGLRSTIPGLEPREAPRPAQQAGIRPAGQQQSAPRPPARPEGDDAAGAPLQLPGVITNGPRPGAQAGIRPRQTAAPSQPTAAERKKQTAAASPKAQPKSQAKAQPKVPPAKKQPAEAE